MSFAKVVLIARPDSHAFEDRHVLLNEPAKIGRSVAKAKPAANNGVFDCKVLSRNHALIWFENDHFYVQDTKSSNGTYVNNQRLSKANEESVPYEIFVNDVIQFGVEIVENAKKITHGCVIASVQLFFPDGTEARECRSAVTQSGDEAMANRGGDGQRTSSGPGGLQSGGALGMTSGVGQIHAHEVYALANCLHEALVRESALDTKLRSLDAALNVAMQSADVSWKALLDEERLVSKLDAVQQQLSVYAALANALSADTDTDADADDDADDDVDNIDMGMGINQDAGADDTAWKQHGTEPLEPHELQQHLGAHSRKRRDSLTATETETEMNTEKNSTLKNKHKKISTRRTRRARVEHVASELRDRVVAMQAERAVYEESAKSALQNVLEQKEAASRQCSEAERRAAQLEEDVRSATERIDSLQKQLEALARASEEHEEESRKRDARHREEEREREAEIAALRRDRERLEQLTLQFSRTGTVTGTGIGTYKINEGSLLDALRRFGEPDGSKLDDSAKSCLDAASLHLVGTNMLQSDTDKSQNEATRYDTDENDDSEAEHNALQRLSDELSRILERCRISSTTIATQHDTRQESQQRLESDVDSDEQHKQAEQHTHTGNTAELHEGTHQQQQHATASGNETSNIDDVIDEMFKLDALDTQDTDADADADADAETGTRRTYHDDDDDDAAQRLSDSNCTLNTLTDTDTDADTDQGAMYTVVVAADKEEHGEKSDAGNETAAKTQTQTQTRDSGNNAQTQARTNAELEAEIESESDSERNGQTAATGAAVQTCAVQSDTIECLKAAFDEMVDFMRKRDAVRREARARNAEQARNVDALRAELLAARSRVDEQSRRIGQLEAELDRCKAHSDSLAAQYSELEQNAASNLEALRTQVEDERSALLQRQAEYDALRAQLEAHAAAEAAAVRSAEVKENEKATTVDAGKLTTETTILTTDRLFADTALVTQLGELSAHCDELKRRLALAEEEATACRSEKERLAAALAKRATEDDRRSTQERQEHAAGLMDSASTIERGEDGVGGTQAQALEQGQVDLFARGEHYERELAVIRRRARQVSGFAMVPVLVIVLAIMVRLCLWLSNIGGSGRTN